MTESKAIVHAINRPGVGRTRPSHISLANNTASGINDTTKSLLRQLNKSPSKSPVAGISKEKLQNMSHAISSMYSSEVVTPNTLQV